MTRPLFFVPTDALTADRVVIDGDEGRHAADVRRLRVGEPVDVGDGGGKLVRGQVAESGRGRLVVEVQDRRDVPPADPAFVVVQALAKGGRDEDAVEAMTEIGVDEVLGWQAARSVARWSDRTAHRWTATARAAAKQARRAWVPATAGPLTTTDVAGMLAVAALAVVLHEDATQSLAAVPVPTSGRVVIVVGPEGGVTDDEVAAFAAAGARVCRLGEQVLRTSTAGVAALSVLSAATRWR